MTLKAFSRVLALAGLECFTGSLGGLVAPVWEVAARYVANLTTALVLTRDRLRTRYLLIAPEIPERPSICSELVNLFKITSKFSRETIYLYRRRVQSQLYLHFALRQTAPMPVEQWPLESINSKIQSSATSPAALSERGLMSHSKRPMRLI